jgi:hypothetical protein
MQWKLFSEEKPEPDTRIIIHRLINNQSYVDVISYYEEPKSGLKPWVDIKGITHWMNLPDAPKDL